MKHILLGVVSLALLAACGKDSDPAELVADLAAGKAIAEADCAECHGMDGHGASTDIPYLAAQSEQYLVEAMHAYRDGGRLHPALQDMTARMSEAEAQAMKTRGPFVNRGLQDWYFINDKSLGGRIKGGTVDFLLRHPNPISKAMTEKWDNSDQLVWGRPLQKRLKSLFTDSQYLRYEIFCDWLPTDNCFVSLDKSVTDKWGSPVAKVRIGYHEHDLKVGHYINEHAIRVLDKMGAQNIRSNISGSPPQNLLAGGCRFGKDPARSVLDPDCRAHDAENLYVTDGSFMPTGGSVPYTWTIYANAFRVADKIKDSL